MLIPGDHLLTRRKITGTFYFLATAGAGKPPPSAPQPWPLTCRDGIGREVAGNPKKREKLRAQQAAQAGIDAPIGTPAAELAQADDIPDAIPAGSNARARNYARTRAPAPARPRRYDMGPGPATRSMADNLQAEQLAKFAAALHPGITLSIERIRPSWCSGWLEEYATTDGTLGELFEYLQSEYGGQTYRLIVQHPDGRPYYETRINIAGQPRDRGRIINRATWEGSEQPAEHRPAPVQSSNDSALWSKILDLTVSNNERVLQAVQSMGAAQTEATRHLIETIVRTRETTDQQKSFLGQLNQFVEAREALTQVSEVLTEKIRENPEDSENLANSAMKDFLRVVMAAQGQKYAAKLAGFQPPDKRPPGPPPDVPAARTPTNGKRPRQSAPVDAPPARSKESQDGRKGR